MSACRRASCRVTGWYSPKAPDSSTAVGMQILRPLEINVITYTRFFSALGSLEMRSTGSTIMNVASSVAVKSPRIYLQHIMPDFQSASFRDCPIQALGGPSTATVWAALQVPCKAVAFCSESLSFKPVQYIITQAQLLCALASSKQVVLRLLFQSLNRNLHICAQVTRLCAVLP